MFGPGWLTVAFVALLVSGGYARAESAPHVFPSLHGLVSQLETARKIGELPAADLTRLAELYFLTSRCTDIKALMTRDSAAVPALTRLACACGGDCKDGKDSWSPLWRFRAILDKSKVWGDSSVQKAWNVVHERPEAKYLAVKAMVRSRDDGDQSVAALRLKLEQSLESMEVH